jgi:hypothetical protein
MYKPDYYRVFDDWANAWITIIKFDSEYNQWAHKNRYTQAISEIINHWGWVVIFPLADHGIIKRNEDESLTWTLKNLDSLAQLFHDWPLSYDPDMPEKYKHIRGGFWAPIETAFNIKRGSLRSKVSSGGRYYDRENPEYKKIIEALEKEFRKEDLMLWNPKLYRTKKH